MEGGMKSETKASSDEAESAEQVNDDAGTGRSYECMFCKRGFTTAQALGGHMNIHRKDRAKMRQPSAPLVRKPQDQFSSYVHHQQSYMSHKPLYPHPSLYNNVFTGSSSVGKDTKVYGDDIGVGVRRPQELSLFSEEVPLSLSMSSFNDGISGDYGGEKMKEGEELDLELRLGHHHEP
ncbi:hypothetical protein J5N97_024186 [Dioscorea zingiberensis]|uniref:C2H2-type domain-containing protein n=1 Tax=Dioscorea zingiberensis TaxID=325984 RepID=A0A9D5C6N0_9LILI|nr:hypothetical protein J5N97_024186 [Dioscorea zingiberensis]